MLIYFASIAIPKPISWFKLADGLGDLHAWLVTIILKIITALGEEWEVHLLGHFLLNENRNMEQNSTLSQSGDLQLGIDYKRVTAKYVLRPKVEWP